MTHFYDESSALKAARACAHIAGSGAKVADDRPGLAIVGVGMMGREHMRVAHLLGRARLRGIYDQSSASLALASREMVQLKEPAPYHYPSLEAVFADPAVDAVIISTPNYTHWELVRAALNSGKALLVEKPMATRLEDALAMVEAVRGYDGLFQLGMQYRFKAQYVDIFAAVKNDKALGDVKTISMSEYRPPFLDKVQQWNKFNVYSGGTLVEKCCHYFDLINQMAGALPQSVYASGGAAVNFLDFDFAGANSDIDDHAFVIINYCNGIRASFCLNMFSQELYEEMVVVGEKGRAVAFEHASFKRDEPSRGSLQVEVAGHPSYQAVDVSYPRVIEESGHSGATFFAQECFLDRLAGHDADGATAMQGLWAIIVASAAQKSMREKNLVDINEFLGDYGTSVSALADDLAGASSF